MKRISFLSNIVIIYLLTMGNALAQVGQRTISYEDKSRERKLITEIWYPTNQIATDNNESPFIRLSTVRDAPISNGKFPLILFSHGTGGGRLTVEWFCAGLAAKGFVVAAVDHFGNTFDNPIPEAFAKFWERPQDLHYVLDQLITSDIASSINQSAIGAAGFSLGGYTSLALAGGKLDYQSLVNYFKTEDGKKEANIPEMPGLISFFDRPEIQESFKKAPSLHDPRIKSVFVMSPALGQGFPSKENFKDLTVPVFIVAGGNDQICPVKTNASHYSSLISKAQFKIVGTHAGHYVFLNEAKEGLKNEAPVFFKDIDGVDRRQIHDQTLSYAVDHFIKTLKK
ncbi:alpha/beta fold hydrolase [Chryseolinea sp. H1M3-3]|uniref:alpha/beta hydrolase family protein n=1 Tax=Chryseolinea sp. H1M3-3 TaxID=3034144 RepID=UPI0023EAD0D6|nr:alpha/beta fold hydrolase [Chryseolinea sp. H1M3-3]